MPPNANAIGLKRTNVDAWIDIRRKARSMPPGGAAKAKGDRRAARIVAGL